MRLDRFDAAAFDRGAPQWVEAAWLVVSAILVSSWIPGSGWRVHLLKLFGATIGDGVVIKPHIQIKFPWRLNIGSHCWIGERVWIDNLVKVTIAENVCISQAVYICTGSHDWASETFDLIERSVIIEASAWIGARSVVAPGCHVGEGAVVTLGGAASGNLEPWMIYGGVPARAIKRREIFK